MSKKSITVRRDTGNIQGFMRSEASVGTDGYNAINSIPGCIDVEIESEPEGLVVISYSWDGREDFDRIDEHLADFGLVRVIPE